MIEKVYFPYQGIEIFADSGEELTKNTIVYYEDGKLFKADTGTIEHSYKLLGLVKNSVSTNKKTKILVEGVAQDESWNWDSSNSLLLGTNGDITQTVPTSGFIKIIAKPISKTQILFKPETSIILA